MKQIMTFDMICPFSAWIKVEQLKPYHPHKEEMIKINKGKRFQQAVDAVEEYLKKAKGKDQVCRFISNELHVYDQLFSWFKTVFSSGIKISLHFTCIVFHLHYIRTHNSAVCL